MPPNWETAFTQMGFNLYRVNVDIIKWKTLIFNIQVKKKSAWEVQNVLRNPNQY